MALPELNAVISQKVEVATGLAIFSIKPVGWELQEFTPGQFTTIGLPGNAKRHRDSMPEDPPSPPDKMIRRAYSIASGSVQKDHLELYVKMVTTGQLTPRLFALEPGDKLWLAPKVTGMFTLEEVPKDKNIIFFATGTGLAPYMSMLRSSVIIKEERQYAVVHGAYNSRDLGYRDELLTIERLCHNFIYIPIISHPQDEPTEWKGLTGFVRQAWTDGLIRDKWGLDITPENTHAFLCGHPEMITGMIELLGASGFSEHSKKVPGNIHTEKYW